MPKHRVLYGNSTIDGGLFLRKQTFPPVSSEYQDGEGRYFKHLSTFSGRSTIKESLVELIGKAQNYIFFTSFLIQDEQIIQSLVDAVRRLKGRVYVLTTLKDNDFIESLDGEMPDEQWNFKEHIKCIEELVHNGIFVKARKDCHAKFAVIDDKYAIVTSANSVPTCFADIHQQSGHLRQANPENGILMDIPSEVVRIANFFRTIWRSAYNYYVSPDANVFEIGEFRKEIIPIVCSEPASASDDGQILWTAPNDCRILNSITEMIDSAEQTIVISSWVLKGIKGHLLSHKLLDAAKRGVKIEILLRGMYRGDHLDSCYYLKKRLGEQVNIHGDFCNHSKAVLVDGKEAMIMSANIDSQHGLDSSVEVGFLSRETEFVKSVSVFLDRLRSGCCLEFVANPRQKHAAERFAILSKPVLTGDISIIIEQQWKDRNHIVNKLISQMNSQLVRVSKPDEQKNQKMCLLTNGIIVDCVNHGQNRLKVLRISETPQAANLRFHQILPETVIEINMS